MTNEDSQTHFVGEAIGAPIRVDERVTRLASRLEPGEIAVLDQSDLDRNDALALIARRPIAVLNAASSVTGRHPTIGAQMLVDADIVLVDDLGSDLMTLTEGDTVEIVDGNVFAKGTLIAAGQRRDASELQAMRAGNDVRIGMGVAAFASTASVTWQREGTMLLGQERIPHLSLPRQNKMVLIVSPGDNLQKDLRALRAFCRDYDPLVVAVDGAAEQMKALRRRPSVLVGDVSSLSEKKLRSAKQIVLLERPDGSTPGRDKVVGYARDFQVLPTSASATDAAILLADASGARQIVTVGHPLDLPTFFDQPGAQQTSSFFIRIRAANKLLPGAVAAGIYRSRLSNFSLLWLILAALLVIAVALWLTPWGQSIWSPWDVWAVAEGAGFRSEALWPQLIV